MVWEVEGAGVLYAFPAAEVDAAFEVDAVALELPPGGLVLTTIALSRFLTSFA